MSSSAPGQRAKALVVELRRAAANGPLHLTRYNEEGLRHVLSESKELYGEIENLVGDTPLNELPDQVKIAAWVHQATIKRNKRCALTYVDNRAATIKKLRWDLGPLFPSDIQTNLSHREASFLADYDKLLTDYNKATGVDVTADLVPPKDLLIQVRVLKDCGEIMTETGAITLEKGTTHSLRRRDIEQLVRQGYLEEHQQHESC
jgi:GINS complex subunit 1